MHLAYVDPTGALLSVFAIILLVVAWINTYVGLKNGLMTKNVLQQLAAMLVVVIILILCTAAWSLGLFANNQ